MEPKVTPSFFYGSACAALMGLALGLSLHGPVESHAGGPRTMIAGAAADVLAQADDYSQPINTDTSGQTSSELEYTLYDGYLPPSPLPVTRLQPGRYPMWQTPGQHNDVQQASFDVEPQQDADALLQEADAELAEAAPAPDTLPTTPVRYSALAFADTAN